MDGEAEGGERRDDKPRGVSKAKLADLDLNETISIWYKANPSAPNFELFPKIPKAAATLFCNKIFDHFRKDGKKDEKMYKVFGGERAAFESIFAWIRDCEEDQSILKYPDIPEPEKDPLKPTVDIIIAGNILEVPAGSLGFFLEKRLNFIARKHLMPFNQVKVFYTPGTGPYKAGLRKIACASIFNAWWDYRLDESITPELMEQLSDLRDNFPKLDQDLHDAVEEKDAAMQKGRLEKKLKREAEQNSNGQEKNFGSGWDQPVDGAADWMNDRIKADTGVSEWDKPAPKSDQAGWDHSQAETTGGDWADEVNEQCQQPSFVAAPGNGW